MSFTPLHGAIQNQSLAFFQFTSWNFTRVVTTRRQIKFSDIQRRKRKNNSSLFKYSVTKKIVGSEKFFHHVPQHASNKWNLNKFAKVIVNFSISKIWHFSLLYLKFDLQTIWKCKAYLPKLHLSNLIDFDLIPRIQPNHESHESFKFCTLWY